MGKVICPDCGDLLVNAYIKNRLCLTEMIKNRRLVTTYDQFYVLSIQKVLPTSSCTFNSTLKCENYCKQNYKKINGLVTREKCQSINVCPICSPPPKCRPASMKQVKNSCSDQKVDRFMNERNDF